MMKLTFFLLSVFLLFTILSCDFDKQGRNNTAFEDKFLFEKIQPYGRVISFFESECLNQLEVAFLTYEVWPENAQIIEACLIDFDDNTLKLETRNIGNKSSVFLGFLYSVDEAKYTEFYMYNKDSKDFTPLRFVEDKVYQDTIFLVRLYLNNGVYCGNLELHGTNSKEFYQNGIFRLE